MVGGKVEIGGGINKRKSPLCKKNNTAHLQKIAEHVGPESGVLAQVKEAVGEAQTARESPSHWKDISENLVNEKWSMSAKINDLEWEG